MNHKIIQIIFFLSYRCKIPGYHNDTYEIQNEYHGLLVNKTIPVTGKDNNGDHVYESCLYNKIDNATNGSVTHVQDACETWVYDKSIYESTFASEVREKGRALT